MIEIQKGQIHPLNILKDQSFNIFKDMGFEVAYGPEIEDEWHNFDALNVPADHPARDMQDTFFIKSSNISQNQKNSPALPSMLGLRHGSNFSDSAPSFVLRTHNTNTTARKLEEMAKNNQVEGAYISIGKVFRNEATDATHEMQFYQIDGFAIGENINLSNMKAVLIEFYKKVLGENTEIEFRPSFFPFTEPSIEVHAKWNGKWLEMMGGGMIHPEVIKKSGLDPEKVQGFAFGGGLDRIAMIKWNIKDIRLFYQGDLRINQF